MICATCGKETEILVRNTQTWVQECWPCVAGPDEMMLRRVKIEFENGRFEIIFVHAESNLKAFVLAKAGRSDVVMMLATPVPN